MGSWKKGKKTFAYTRSIYSPCHSKEQYVFNNYMCSKKFKLYFSLEGEDCEIKAMYEAKSFLRKLDYYYLASWKGSTPGKENVNLFNNPGCLNIGPFKPFEIYISTRKQMFLLLSRRRLLDFLELGHLALGKLVVDHSRHSCGHNIYMQTR